MNKPADVSELEVKESTHITPDRPGLPIICVKSQLSKGLIVSSAKQPAFADDTAATTAVRLSAKV